MRVPGARAEENGSGRFRKREKGCGHEMDEDDSVPEEIEEQCLQCHESLVGTDRLLKPVMSVSRAQMEERVGRIVCVGVVKP